MAGMGKLLIAVGMGLSVVTWLATAAAFFADDRAGLAVILLLIPPAELILPWVASTTLGLMSLGGLVSFIIGAALFDAEA